MAVSIDYTAVSGPILASELIRKVGVILLDEKQRRWTGAELLDWLNEAIVATVSAVPSAAAFEVIITLEAGAAQRLPDSVQNLVRLVANVDATGKRGRAVSLTDLELMNLSAPDWQSAKAASAVRQYMFDERAPQSFYVYPPAAAGVKLAGTLVMITAPLTDPAAVVPLQPQYADALLDYMLYRANCKDSEFANGNLAQSFYAAWQGALGIKQVGDKTSAPRVKQ